MLVSIFCRVGSLFAFSVPPLRQHSSFIPFHCICHSLNRMQSNTHVSCCYCTEALTNYWSDWTGLDWTGLDWAFTYLLTYKHLSVSSRKKPWFLKIFYVSHPVFIIMMMVVMIMMIMPVVVQLQQHRHHRHHRTWSHRKNLLLCHWNNLFLFINRY